MKACRLKIITANILNENDTPQIHYISQNKKQKKIDVVINNDINNNNLSHYIEENNKIEKEIIEKITENKMPEELLINDNNLFQSINNENGQNAELNELYTISNKNIYEEQKINNISNALDSNYNPYTHLNNNYPYTIMNKKKGLNSSLRHLFKNRETRTILHKSSNISIHKSLSNSKILNSNNKSLKGKNNKNKINLNQSINKSNILKNSNESTSLKKNKNKSANIIKPKKNYMLRAKPKKTEENVASMTPSWKVIENNDYNIGQTIDFKALIDDLIIKECKLVKEKEELIQIFEGRLKPLRELNKKLMDDNNEELNREDELNGELILLKNQYEKLFNSLNFNEKNMVNKNSKKDIDFDKKQKEIDEEFTKLNNQIKNGEFILITKPANYYKLSEEEDKNITLLLKGTFYSIHVLDTDLIVDKIWKFDKQFQTIYFIVDELLHYFDLDYKYDRNVLINYFYSFLKKYSYLNIVQFKQELKKKIGKMQFLNKYIYLSKLMHFHKTKVNSLIKYITKKDIFSIGIINSNKFFSSLIDCGIVFNSSDKDSQELLEFLIFCMKKPRKLELFEEEKFLENNSEKNRKFSLFDLYYESLIDFIDEYNSNHIRNPFILIRNYMNNNDIISAEKLLRPIITKKNILKINSVDYIDIIVLNKFLRFKGIIREEDCINIKTFEEELIDINNFINDIYTNQDNEENKDNFEDINHRASNLIDEILKLNF